MTIKPGISERPTEAYLVEWLDALGDWKRFGLFLNVSEAYIEKIARKNLHSEDDAKMALFSEWLRTSLKASWRDVIDALKRVSELVVVEEIGQKLRMEPEQQRVPFDPNPQSNFFYYITFLRFLNDNITICYSIGPDAYGHVDVVKRKKQFC